MTRDLLSGREQRASGREPILNRAWFVWNGRGCKESRLAAGRNADKASDKDRLVRAAEFRSGQ